MSKSRLYKIIVSGLLVAVSIILSYAKIDLTDSLRISFAFLPIMLSGALLGPGWGAAAGVLGDVLGFLIKPTGTYFPPIALTAMLAGVIPGLLFMLLKKRALWVRCALSALGVQILGSLLLQSLWLSVLYTSPYTVMLLSRIPVALGMIPVFGVLMYILLSALYKAKLDRKIL